MGSTNRQIGEATVVPDLERPLWSVLIPVYNCGDFLTGTLRSVLVQDPGPAEMEIVVVDDHSTKDPAGVVAAVGGGRVAYTRHNQNVGHVRNFNACIRRSRGELLHLLHGDDQVLPGFYSAMERVFRDNPEIGAAFCRHHYIDDSGNIIKTSPLVQPRSGVLPDAARLLARKQIIQPPAIVVRREVYASLGGFDGRFETCGEDWEMWVRIAANYPVWYEVEPLAQYRRHERSLAARSLLSGQNMKDVRTAISTFKRYFPEGDTSAIISEARHGAATWALSLAERAWYAGNRKTAVIQGFEALRTSWSLRTMRVAAGVSRRILLNRPAQNRVAAKEMGVKAPRADRSGRNEQLL
jgi:glycosyltransferase involved in cell wall biosynthesis